MTMRKIILRERDMLKPIKAVSLFIGGYQPFGHSVPEINVCNGIIAPVNGSLNISAIYGGLKEGWRWEYTVALGDEWEYTTRDEFQETHMKAFNDWRARDFGNLPSMSSPRHTYDEKTGSISFIVTVDRLAMTPFSGAELGRAMFDMGIPIVMLQNQIVGVSWGSLGIEAVDDLDGWHLHFVWTPDDGSEPHVAGQEVIDNWRAVCIEHAVHRFVTKKGGTPRDEEMSRKLWATTYPPTTTDDLGRIVDDVPEPEEDDDDEL